MPERFIDNPKTYINLAAWLQKQDSYVDWEGFSDPDEVINYVETAAQERRPIDENDPEEMAKIRIVLDLLTHWVHMIFNEGDPEADAADISLERLVGLYDFLYWLLDCNYFARSNDQGGGEEGPSEDWTYTTKHGWKHSRYWNKEDV